MKERKMSSDIITAIISVFLSTGLIIVTVIFSLYLSLLSFVEGGGIADIAKNLSRQTLEEAPVITQTVEKYGFKEEKVDEFLKSDAVKEASELYGKDIIAAMQGDTEGEAEFTTEKVQAVMVNHLDELVDIATEKGMEEEKILATESKIMEAIKKSTSTVVKTVTTKKEIVKGIEKSGLEDFAHAVSNPSVKTVFLIILIALCIAIYTLRYYKFGGLVWLGTDFIFSAAVLLVIIILSVTGVFSSLLSGVIVDGVITDSVIWALTKDVIVACAVLVLITVLCFVGFNLLKKYTVKKKKINP